MKRVLVLILPFTVGLTVNAATVYNLTADETSVYLNVTGPPEDVYGAMAIESPGVFTAARLGPQAPDGSSWDLMDPPTSAMGMFLGAGYEDGVWAITDYSVATAVTVYFYTTPDGASYDLQDSIVVPEPTTIALFGLGAILLYRRRK